MSGEPRTVRERVATIEAKTDRLDKLILDYEGMEGIHLSLTTDLEKTNANIAELNKKIDKIYPVFRDIIAVKGYGSITWKILRYTGAIVMTCIASWHLFKEHIKHIIHYLFN